MAAESKELIPEPTMDEIKQTKPIVMAKTSTTDDDGVFGMVYSVVKKIATVGIIYFVGYMGWSVAWLIGKMI